MLSQEGGLSTPAGLPRWGPRLAHAMVESHSTSGDKPPFPTALLQRSYLASSRMAPPWSS
jgi:hypothetical protein